MFAVPLLAVVLGTAQPLPEFPQQVGAVNDYGQTLGRADRERLDGLIGQLQGKGLSFVYLATWHDPFGDLATYAARVFSAWRLPPEAVLIVFLRDEARRWRVEARFGEKARLLVASAEWDEILTAARIEANRAQPAFAVTNLAERLLGLLVAGPKPPQASGRPWVWAYVMAGLIGIGGLVLAARLLLCPHCLRPLRRRPSFRGILWVCPRCRFTRAAR